MRCPFCGHDETKVVDSRTSESQEKRDVPVERLEALIDDMESQLHNEFRYEVDSRQVGDMVLLRLRDLDRVAYVRFASVYKEFKDLDEFTSELKGLSKQ